MSRSNVVEIGLRWIDAFNRGDIDGMADLTTPDFEWVPAMAAIEGEVFRGREGIETYRGRLDEAWEDLRAVADEFRDLGGLGLFVGRIVGRGRTSGAPVEAPLGVVADICDGAISVIRTFLDHGEALRAAGLTE